MKPKYIGVGLLILLIMMIGLTSAYTADSYTNISLVLSGDSYTADNYYDISLVLGEAVVTCTVTTDTTYTNQEVDCSGQTYLVSNGAIANFIDRKSVV